MFSVPPSLTDDMTIEIFLDRLQQHTLVCGLVVAGSHGRGELKPESDYDVVIVLREYAYSVHVILTTIEQRMADIMFWREDQLDEMLQMQTIGGNTAESAVFHWIKTGDIVYDPTGKLQKLCNHPVAVVIGSNRRDLFNIWYRVNFNLYHGERMLQSNDEVYLLAMDMRFLYMLLEVLDAYLMTRGIPQRGEKHTIRYLRQHAPDDLTLYLQALQAKDRQQRFIHYKAFAETALAPIGGLWTSSQMTAFNLHDDLPVDDYQHLIDFWRDLLMLNE